MRRKIVVNSVGTRGLEWMSELEMMRKSRCAPGEIPRLGSYAGINSLELSLFIVRIHTGDGENVFK
jgi:hypothetical protein